MSLPKRLLHQCQYRGMRECDLIFRRFVEFHKFHLDVMWNEDQWLFFEKLLNETEASLYEWLIIEKNIPTHYSDLIKFIKLQFLPTSSEDEFNQYACQFAQFFMSRDQNIIPICFFGNLGAGKTTFIRQVIRKFCNSPDLIVSSPTFNLVNEYCANGVSIWHADLYRLTDPNDCYDIGILDAINTSLCLIEWPEKMGYLLPQSRIDITINMNKDNSQGRIIQIKEIN